MSMTLAAMLSNREAVLVWSRSPSSRAPRRGLALRRHPKCSYITTPRHREFPVTVTSVTSREFNQDVGRAKRAATSGPVFITDRGKAAHVLLCIEDYQRLAGRGRSLAEALSMQGLADIDFEPPRLRIESRVPHLP